jgi:hypothetical protein
MNVNSWAPDSMRFAYVTYETIPQRRAVCRPLLRMQPHHPNREKVQWGGVTIDFGRRRAEEEAATLIIFETADVRKEAPCT